MTNAAEKISTSKNTAAQNKASAANAAFQQEVDEATAAYEAVKADAPDLTTAFAHIAAFFYEPGMIWDAAERRETPGNQLAYTQKDVLNGICYTLLARARKQQEPIDKARADVMRLAEAQRNDEVSMNKVEQSLNWLERLIYQQTSLEEIYKAACVAHLAVTGTRFIEPKIDFTRNTGNDRNDAVAADINKRMAAMGLSATVADAANTNGVE